METTSLFWKQLYGVCVSMCVLACVPYICMTGSDATKRAAYFSTSLVASSVNVVGCSHLSALLQAIAWMQARRVGTGCVLGVDMSQWGMEWSRTLSRSHATQSSYATKQFPGATAVTTSMKVRHLTHFSCLTSSPYTALMGSISLGNRLPTWRSSAVG